MKSKGMPIRARRRLLGGVFWVFLSVWPAGLVAESDVFPEPISDLSNFVFGDAGFDPPSTDLEVRVQLSCYRVNVRKQKNGLNTDATLLASIPVEGRTDRLNVVFPAGMFFGRPADPTNVMVVDPVPDGTQVGFDPETGVLYIRTRLRGSEQLKKPKFYQVHAQPTPDRVRTKDGQKILFLGSSPQQTDFDLRTSFVSQSVSQTLSSDGRVATVRASFPGARRHCGSYKSPLMLFFDEKRPQFTGSPLTLLSEEPGVTHSWVERGAPGYFLALDRDGYGRISHKDELFAGFETLRKLDANGDGVIDKRDKAYKKLRLWQDLNADGESSPNELHGLDKLGVQSISLKYESDRIEALGHYAEVREFGEFTFRTRRGEVKKGKALDVWFKENLPTQQAIVKSY